MNGYLLSIVGVVLLSAFLTAILPEGKTSGLIKSVMRVACILAIVSPVLSFFQSGALSVGKIKNFDTIFSQSVIETGSAFINYHSEMRVAEAENALEKEIYDKYLLTANVRLEWEQTTETVAEKYPSNSIHITRIYVKTLEQQDEEVLRNMWEYLTKNYCSEVLIE